MVAVTKHKLLQEFTLSIWVVLEVTRWCTKDFFPPNYGIPYDVIMNYKSLGETDEYNRKS